MNATELAQSEFDNRLPPPVSESPLELAGAEWLYNAVEQLVKLGCDVKVQRRLRKPQAVTVAQLALAADELVNNRQASCEVGTPALGWLLIANNCGRSDKDAAAELDRLDDAITAAGSHELQAVASAYFQALHSRVRNEQQAWEDYRADRGDAA